MITVGIDLAAQPERTAACRIEWNAGAARVTDLDGRNVDDARILELVEGANRSGLDVPLGWPEAFVVAVGAHHAAQRWPGGTPAQLRLRATDRWVAERTGRWPLSVSTDRIAMPAFRTALVLSRASFPVDRAGGGRVVEVYPAAALLRWGFDSRRYKRVAGAEARASLVRTFVAPTRQWLTLDDAMINKCIASDDAFDALVAALVARAAAIGLTEPIPADSRELAAREGWIALPVDGSLDRLA